MATAVTVGPALATLTPALGGAVLQSSIGGAAIQPSIGAAALLSVSIGDAHIVTTIAAPPASATAAVGAAVVGTSTVG